jgi:hypothetical protein
VPEDAQGPKGTSLVASADGVPSGHTGDLPSTGQLAEDVVAPSRAADPGLAPPSVAGADPGEPERDAAPDARKLPDNFLTVSGDCGCVAQVQPAERP